MKNKKYYLGSLLFIIPLLVQLLSYVNTPKNNPDELQWGFYGHKRINRIAVFTLPPEMLGFYKEHIEFLT
jgi:hypothetical protein